MSTTKEPLADLNDSETMQSNPDDTSSGVREAQFLINIMSHQDDAAMFVRAYGPARIVAAWKALNGE